MKWRVAAFLMLATPAFAALDPNLWPPNSAITPYGVGALVCGLKVEKLTITPQQTPDSEEHSVTFKNGSSATITARVWYTLPIWGRPIGQRITLLRGQTQRVSMGSHITSRVRVTEGDVARYTSMVCD